MNPYQVREAADVVQKLHLIAQELPYDRFAKVRVKHCLELCFNDLYTIILSVLFLTICILGTECDLVLRNRLYLVFNFYKIKSQERFNLLGALFRDYFSLP